MARSRVSAQGVTATRSALLSLLSAAAVAAVPAVAAGAVTYTNGDSGISITAFGADAAQSYGEVIDIAAAATLTGFSFWLVDGDAGNFTFAIAAWDGSQPVGANLYAAAGSYAGGIQELQFSGIDTALAAGSYIVYVTVDGVSDPVTDGYMELGAGRGPIGGGFQYQYPAWSDLASRYDAQYSATFATTSDAVEPASSALLLGGLGLLGAAARRRRRA